jgi:lysophospholipase L1-like esterase
MSQIGALTRRMLNFDPEHLHSQLRRRDPNLVVFMFGGNDMNTQGTMQKYREEYTAVIRLFRAAKQPMACLVMAPLDHGEREGSRIITRPIVTKIVDAQREVAKAEGCAFFDTYEAMGGDGSMGRWVRSNPALGSGDLSHLTHHGHKVVGGLLYRALVAGYVDYRKRMVGTPVILPKPAAPEPAPADPAVNPSVHPSAPGSAPESATPASTVPAAPAANGPAAAAAAAVGENGDSPAAANL